MQQLSYTAVQRSDGQRISGRAAAYDARVLRQQLEDRGLLVVRIEKTIRRLPIRPARKHTAHASRALASFLSAGLPLAHALRAAEDAVAPMRQTLSSVRTSIERGESASTAFSHFPEQFDPLFIATLRAGESAGDLSEAFNNISDHLEREVAFRGKLLSAAVYPAVLLVAGGAALATMVTYVLPQFAALLTEAGSELPASTRRMMWVSGFARAHATAIVTAVALAACGLGWSAHTQRGRWLISRALLLTPGVGGVRRKVLGARISRMLSVMLTGGVPLYHALSKVAECISDPIAASGIREAHRRVRQGSSLSAAFSSIDVVPPVMIQFIKVGEGAGSVGAYTGRVADLMESDVQRALERITSLLEPLVIIVFGLATGVIAMTLLQAIYGLNVGGVR